MTSGTPPAWNTCTVGWCFGPFGSASTRRGTRLLTSVQSAAVGPAETCGVGDGGEVQDQVRRPAERRVGHHRVLKRGVGQNLAHRDAALFEPHQRGRRPLGHVEPDRMSGGRECGMAERHPERFGDDLRRGRGAEELAAAARGRTGAAAEIGGILQRDLIVHVAHANRLDARGVLALLPAAA